MQPLNTSRLFYNVLSKTYELLARINSKIQFFWNKYFNESLTFSFKLRIFKCKFDNTIEKIERRLCHRYQPNIIENTYFVYFIYVFHMFHYFVSYAFFVEINFINA